MSMQSAQAGVLELLADGSAGMSSSFRFRMMLTMPKSCLSARLRARAPATDPRATSPIQDVLDETRTTCADRGHTCHCAVTTLRSAPFANEVRYRTEDGYLLFSNEEDPLRYCVRGDELTMEFQKYEDGGFIFMPMRLQRL